MPQSFFLYYSTFKATKNLITKTLTYGPMKMFKNNKGYMKNGVSESQ